VTGPLRWSTQSVRVSRWRPRQRRDRGESCPAVDRVVDGGVQDAGQVVMCKASPGLQMVWRRGPDQGIYLERSPGRNRTSDTRFGKPVAPYPPLSCRVQLTASPRRAKARARGDFRASREAACWATVMDGSQTHWALEGADRGQRTRRNVASPGRGVASVTRLKCGNVGLGRSGCRAGPTLQPGGRRYESDHLHKEPPLVTGAVGVAAAEAERLGSDCQTPVVSLRGSHITASPTTQGHRSPPSSIEECREDFERTIPCPAFLELTRLCRSAQRSRLSDS
jgi:hypothetical protein